MPGRSTKFRTGYKRGGVAGKGKGGGGGSAGTTATKKKEPGIIRSTIDKLRKKFIPTFGEQHETATKAGKKKFTSTRFKKKGRGWTGETIGELEYATTKKPKIEKKIAKSKVAALKAKEGKGGGADSGSKKKPVYEKATGTKVSGRGKAFAAARKAGKKFFMYGGKKYHTRLKGEEKDKPTIDWKKKKVNIKLPELSGGSAKKIKTFVGAQAGGRIADAARRAQIHGFYSPDMGMGGRDPRMGRRDPRMGMRGPGPNVTGGRRGFAKGGLIKGKPKIAVRGW